MFSLDFDKRLAKKNVFLGESTYINDYRRYKYEKLEKFEWPNARNEPPPRIISKQLINLNIQTFQPWDKGAYIPFDLLWTPKDIVRTNPFDIFKKKETVDLATKYHVKEFEAVKVSSKICIPPAINVDDIQSKEDRDMLIKFMYTTEFKAAMEETIGSFKSKPLPTYNEIQNFAKCNEKNIIPEIPENKLENVAGWDADKIRAIAEPTEYFWKEYPSMPENKFICPIEDITQEDKDKIKMLIKKDELRFPYDYLKPHYDGYVPKLAKGVTLEKGNKPITHPRITVLQALTRGYAEDVLNKES